MRFCVYCGNELRDEAVICCKCGCMVKDLNYTQFNHIEEKSESLYGKEPKLITILNFIWSSLLTLAVLFIFIGLFDMQVYVGVRNSYAFGYIYVYTWYYIVSFILNSVSLIVLIIYYVVNLKIGSTLSKVLNGILRIIITLSVLVVTILFAFCW